MPIIIKDFEWKETESVVTVKVPSHGAHPSKVDIFSSKYYIKASYDAYFFEALLFEEIDINKSTCTIIDNFIIFEMIKVKPQLWHRLEVDVEKAERQRLKKIYVEEEHKRFQEEEKEKRDQRYELKRVAVREQVELDSQERQKIENIKKEEKEKALQAIDTWQDESKDKDIPVDIKKKTPKHRPRKRFFKKELPKKEIVIEELQKPAYQIPGIRQSNTTYVDFTPRTFPTPSRESRLEEENEWLRKQAEARRSVGFVSEDLRPEEKNPQYLKAKGDEFMKNNNYLGAISAYSFGIKLNDQFVDLYIARSEAQYLQGNYMNATEDCSKALELMKPEVPANLKERVNCIARRGRSLLKLGMRREGISELEHCTKLMPCREFTDELNNAYALDSDSD